jgi:ribosomal-protein-alanine N-acetyltransferase
LLDHIFINIPTLETERLTLRKLLYSDRNDIFEYAQNENVARNVIWFAHKEIIDTIAYLNLVYDSYNNNKAAPWGIQLKNASKIIGTAGFVSWDKDSGVAEIGYALAEDHWGKGLITEAVNEIIKFGFEILELEKIISRCKLENIGSYKVLEKCGFEYEGTIENQMIIKGKPEDMRMYSIKKSDFK